MVTGNRISQKLEESKLEKYGNKIKINLDSVIVKVIVNSLKEEGFTKTSPMWFIEYRVQGAFVNLIID